MKSEDRREREREREGVDGCERGTRIKHLQQIRSVKGTDKRRNLNDHKIHTPKTRLKRAKRSPGASSGSYLGRYAEMRFGLRGSPELREGLVGISVCG